MIDVENPNECGDRPVKNKVTISAGGLTLESNVEEVWIWPQGDGCMH